MRKETKKYYFSVEGETEQWYLQWLQNTINSDPNTQYCVKLDCPIQKDPLKRAKGLVALGKTEIIHVFDYESGDPIHVQQFKTALDRMTVHSLKFFWQITNYFRLGTHDI